MSAQLRAQNMSQKIIRRYMVPKGASVRSGDFVSVQPHKVMTHDNTAAVMTKFSSLFNDAGKSPFVADKEQLVFVLDHNVQDKTEKNLKKYASIEKFAGTHGIHFYPAGRGIGHQVMCEEGYSWPGTFVVASDSHSNMYGGIGCLGTPVVRTDAASIWITGKTWWQVPKFAKVELLGKLPKGSSGKDIIIALCGLFNNDEVLNHAVEFVGEGVNFLSVEERLTIANMTTEWGALSGLFPVDSTSIQWLKDQGAKVGQHPRFSAARIADLEQELANGNLSADAGAEYAITLQLDLSTVHPHVSGPNHVKVMKSVGELEKDKIKIQKAYIVSCVNSRAGDLAAAAEVLKGSKISEGVELYIAAASSQVQEESEKAGHWKSLLDAGAIPLPPGCGPCVGLGAGLLGDGEVGISATNRNFKGRMGHPNAKVFLASPAVVAASAKQGYICRTDQSAASPPGGPQGKVVARAAAAAAPAASAEAVTLADGFPKTVHGPVVFCHENNLNTDGIYAGKWTYDESMTPEKQANVVMENYDPKFASQTKAGSVLIGGYNFGTGSSREQAATAFKYKGIKMLIAGTFSETYKRNAINNGFLCLEVPALVEEMCRRYGRKELTVHSKATIEVDFAACTATLKGGYDGFKDFTCAIPAFGEIAQEIIVAGGTERWVTNKLAAAAAAAAKGTATATAMARSFSTSARAHGSACKCCSGKHGMNCRCCSSASSSSGAARYARNGILGGMIGAKRTVGVQSRSFSSKKHNILVFNGDGVGKEIVPAARSVVDATGASINWVEMDMGFEAAQKGGKMITEEHLQAFEKYGTLFKGPLTIPPSATDAYVEIRGKRFTSANQVFRKVYNLYANIRPAKGLPDPRLPFQGVDLVVVRENTEDLYTGEEKWVDADTVEGIKRITRGASRKIAHRAFDYAEANNRKRITCVHKANVCKQADGLFLSVCTEVAAERMATSKHQFIFDDHLADSLCTKLVQKPQEFDVLLCPNLFGDMLSDLAAGLIGSLGLMPSGQYGEKYAVFEPAHGSAPDIAGKGLVNPVSQLRCASMMLSHIGETTKADQINAAVDKVVTEGKWTTRDLGGKASTKEMTQAVIDALR